MPSTTTILTSIPLLSAISVTFITNHKMKHHRSYIETRTISTSFVRSTTLLRSVNPKHYIRNGLVDTRTIEISNDNIQRLSDEEILARFSKGFFGGWAFFPERTGLWILKMLFGWDLKSSFTGVPPGLVKSSFPLGLEKGKLPPIGTVLFCGNFVVIDSKIKSAVASTSSADVVSIDSNDAEEENDSQAGSHVDIGGGTSDGNFAACHRFEIQRSFENNLLPATETSYPGDSGDESKAPYREVVRIVHSSIACNPSREDSAMAGWIHTFHMVYSRFLFWDGVREVLKG